MCLWISLSSFLYSFRLGRKVRWLERKCSYILYLDCKMLLLCFPCYSLFSEPLGVGCRHRTPLPWCGSVALTWRTFSDVSTAHTQTQELAPAVRGFTDYPPCSPYSSTEYKWQLSHYCPDLKLILWHLFRLTKLKGDLTTPRHAMPCHAMPSSESLSKPQAFRSV